MEWSSISLPYSHACSSSINEETSLQSSESFGVIDRKLVVLILTVLGVCGFVLRVHNLGELGLIVDEGIQALAVDGILQYGYPLVPSGAVYFRSPLFLYLQSFASQVFGMNEFSLRLPGVIFNVCSIGMIYALGKCLFDKKVALLSAFLLAFSVWEIELSQYGRMYTLFQFFFLLSILCFYKGFMIGEKMYRVLTSVTFIVTFSIHAIGLSLLTLFLVPLCSKGYNVMKKWALFIYMGLTFIGMLLYHWGIDRLASYLSRISPNHSDSTEKHSVIDWLLSSVKETFSLPHIGLLKYLYTYDFVIFVILFSLIALLVFWFAYKAFCDWARLGEFGVTIAIILSASIYQFTLVLIGLYVYLFFFYDKLKTSWDSSLKMIVATLIVLFGFWSVYALNALDTVITTSLFDVFLVFLIFTSILLIGMLKAFQFCWRLS